MSGAELKFNISPANTDKLSPISVWESDDYMGIGGIYCVAGEDLIGRAYERDFLFFDIDCTCGDVVSRMIPIGRGPSEYISGSVTQFLYRDGRYYLGIHGDTSFSIYPLDDLKSNGISESIESFRDPSPYVFYAAKIKSGYLLNVILDEDLFSFKLYDEGGGLVRTFHVFGENDPILANYSLFGSAKILKPDGTKLAMLMCSFDKINVLDIEGDDHFAISTSKRKDSNDIAAMVDGLPSRRYYRSAAGTDEYIFALYLDGCPVEEMDGAVPTVQVFDWHGAFICEYHIDEPIISIAVSSDGSVLYGLSEDEKIYKYNIDVEHLHN